MEQETHVGNDTCCFAIIFSLASMIFTFIIMCVCINNSNLKIDCDCDILTALSIIVGILTFLVTLLIGWNIYTVIDIKKQSEQIHDKANSVIDSHTILSETLDSRFKENDSRLEERLRKERIAMGITSSYKRAVSAIEKNPESSFRDFIEIKIQSDEQNEIKLSELALSMMEYIARRKDLSSKISKATDQLTAQQRKDFFDKAMNLINSLPGDFEELRNFVNRIYKVD